MTALDIIVLLLMGGNGILGFRRGFVGEVLSLTVIALAIMVVRLFHAPFAEMLTGIVGTEGGAVVLAFVLLFGLTWFLGRMVARRIGEGTKASLLGPVDRVLGLGFGALKGLLLATVVFVGFAMVYDTIYGEEAARPAWLRHSRTYPLLNASGRAMSEWLAERRTHGGLMSVLGNDEADNAVRDDDTGNGADPE